MKTVLSLFDHGGIMVKPWVDAGYQAWIVDIQHTGALDDALVSKYPVVRIGIDLSLRQYGLIDLARIGKFDFIAAFPPCDHTAVSGARWFKGKGLRALEQSVSMFATAAEICEASGAPYMIENPVSTISTYWREPDYRFNPCDYTGYCPDDNYTKKTCLWTGGGFVMPEPFRDESLPPPDNRIHTAPPGEGRKAFRSLTPKGFAQAVFFANRAKVLSEKMSMTDS